MDVSKDLTSSKDRKTKKDRKSPKDRSSSNDRRSPKNRPSSNERTKAKNIKNSSPRETSSDQKRQKSKDPDKQNRRVLFSNDADGAVEAETFYYTEVDADGLLTHDVGLSLHGREVPTGHPSFLCSPSKPAHLTKKLPMLARSESLPADHPTFLLLPADHTSRLSEKSAVHSEETAHQTGVESDHLKIRDAERMENLAAVGSDFLSPRVPEHSVDAALLESLLQNEDPSNEVLDIVLEKDKGRTGNPFEEVLELVLQTEPKQNPFDELLQIVVQEDDQERFPKSNWNSVWEKKRNYKGEPEDLWMRFALDILETSYVRRRLLAWGRLSFGLLEQAAREDMRHKEQYSRRMQEARTILVLVDSVVGGRMRINLKRGQRCVHVKEAIAQKWQMPASCQKLFKDTVPLLNNEKLVDHCNEVDDTLSILMAVSVDSACHDLLRVGPSMRIQLLGDLGAVGLEGGSVSIAAVSSRLADIDSQVRNAALQVLPKVTRKHDQTALLSVLALLQDGETTIKISALQALDHVSAMGNERVLSAVAVLSHDESKAVRHEAIRFLGGVSDQGNQNVLSALYFRASHDEDPRVRQAAVQTIVQVATFWSWDLISAFQAGLQDAEWQVRLATVRAVVQATALPYDIDRRADNNFHVVSALCACIEQETRFDIKVEALQAIRHFPCAGHETAIAIACKNLNENDWRLRHAGLLALGKTARKGDPHVNDEIRSRLVDEKLWVREAAVNVLELTADAEDLEEVSIDGPVDIDGDGRWEASKDLTEQGEFDPQVARSPIVGIFLDVGTG